MWKNANLNGLGLDVFSSLHMLRIVSEVFNDIL